MGISSSGLDRTPCNSIPAYWSDIGHGQYQGAIIRGPISEGRGAYGRTVGEEIFRKDTLMARTVRAASLGSRTARSELAPRGKPYYRTIEPGLLHLGYRKPKRGAGKWLARSYAGNGRYHPPHTLGVADDFSDADGRAILSFAQAQAAARKIMVKQAGGGVGTVAEAVEAYIAHLEDKGRDASSIKRPRYSVNAHILPALGHVELAKLTDKQLKTWLRDLARAPIRLRVRKGEKPRYRPIGDDLEARRARRLSANRVRATLFAALNFAF